MLRGKNEKQTKQKTRDGMRRVNGYQDRDADIKSIMYSESLYNKKGPTLCGENFNKGKQREMKRC